jgi:ribonuclease-3
VSEKSSLSVLESRLGYIFQSRAWLEQALTHSSKSGSPNNERIEFLGDRVLNLVMAESLFKRFPQESEGSLAKRHSALVQGRMLAIIGGIVGLGEFINMSDAERAAGGGENENILSDAMEATLGAIFLDGGLDVARVVILKLWGDNIDTLTDAHQDPKTELQEWVQARGLPLPEYRIVSRSGPDHAPLFEIEVKVQGYEPIVAEGPSRRQGEKTAAQRMIKHVKGHKE